MKDIYVAGSHWVSKDGKRKVTIESEAARFRGERCFIIVNDETKHWRNISLSGLNAKFIHRSTFAPDYYGVWEKKKGTFKGTRVNITGYVTRVGDTTWVLSGRVVGTDVFFSAPDHRLLTEYSRVDGE